MKPKTEKGRNERGDEAYDGVSVLVRGGGEARARRFEREDSDPRGERRRRRRRVKQRRHCLRVVSFFS